MKTLKEIIKEIRDEDPHDPMQFNELVDWLVDLERALREDRIRRYGIGS